MNRPAMMLAPLGLCVALARAQGALDTLVVTSVEPEELPFTLAREEELQSELERLSAMMDDPVDLTCASESDLMLIPGFDRTMARLVLPRVPVCWECKTRENLCRVVYHHEVCCGAMTRAGCGAPCPSHGVPCGGCRGPVETPNYDANITMFKDRGISWVQTAQRMGSFSAPVCLKSGLEKEERHGR